MLKPFAARENEMMKDVLMHPEVEAPEIHYYMIRGGKDKTNITVWETGTIGGEYIKTYGHYHVGHLDETYHVIQGDGVILLQTRKLDNQGHPINDEIEKFMAIKVKPGDKVFIPSGTGHLAVNTGKVWFVTSDDSPVNFEEKDPVSLPGHADYESVKAVRGFAYYLIEDPSASSTPSHGESGLKLVKNPNYKVIPEPEWLTAQEYAKSLIQFK
ncbi:hypothetical protein A3J13_02300 [Candidatus Daviesbacteria bacterium RIFCSPLOWO2_02_FULL_36_8]|uniref:glucose-6-phosphate isomerase n=1 Tax=Candidatus Daviesbacteria bacterium RIFCSPLOWO2_02_FULL_36_8 TaxID=1797793 RepID=A0A1F5MH30_9BACT|nr:MAG: hypothetical protein A3J13_02300 [Candidatus Daviesbacteria bacterium RIFCSPLOWO2_02_FULL_36_8]